MKLIVESGSSKTDWVLLNTKPQFQKGIGLNPYFLNESALLQEISKKVNYWNESITSIHFYGAGCATPEKQSIIQSVFRKALNDSIPIEVATDMLGAARGLCQKGEGIVSILGTGANACFFRLGRIQQTAPSNGIWLGDEGSGGFLGKKLIQHYLNGDLPKELQASFEVQFSDRRPEILEKVYRSERPNAYLASFAPYIGKNASHPFMAEMLSEAFQAFFHQFILRFPQSEEKHIYLTGSIAYHFSKQIEQEAQKLDLSIAQIAQSPLKGLIEFHQEE